MDYRDVYSKYIHKQKICFILTAPNFTAFPRSCATSECLKNANPAPSMVLFYLFGWELHLTLVFVCFVVFCPGRRWWRDLCWTVVAAPAVSDDGRPVGSGCWCFPAMDVHGGVSHHAPSHVWALAWSHRGLHPDPGQNLGGGERKHFFQCISTE